MTINAEYKKWLGKIQQEEKQHQRYRERAKQVEDRYIEEEASTKTLGSQFNILYSNVETIHSSVLSEIPKPDVRRRWAEQDLDSPEGKVKNSMTKKTAMVIERALSYSVDEYDFKGELDKVLIDRLVPGVGIPRIVYDPDIRTQNKRIPVDVIEDLDDEGNEVQRFERDGEQVDAEVDENGIAFVEEQEKLKLNERVQIQHMPWKCFHWQPASAWANVMWSGFNHILDPDELKEQFPDVHRKIPKMYSQSGEKVDDRSEGGTHAKVYEVFDKRKREVKIFCEGMDDFIEVLDDPMELEQFYPFPQPLFANSKSGKLVPVPDFIFYQDQAEELDRITGRITGLVKQLRHRGIYDGSFAELGQIRNSKDGELVPVDDFAAKFSNGRSLDDVVKYMPLNDLMQVISGLMQQREQLKQTIYEITGLSDIIRGASKASETLGAQKIKTQFAGLRNRLKQSQVDYMIRNIFRLKAEVIANHFDKETLTRMTGIEVTDDMIALMRDDTMRSFKIDVESDSTVFKDQEEEQKNRVEALTAMTQFMTAIMPGIQAGLVPVELAKEMLLWAMRAFKSGREIEDILDEIGTQEQGQLPPGPGGDQAGGQGAGDAIPAELQNVVGLG